MKWQKPKLITDREEIADKVLFPNYKRYCWAWVVAWFFYPELFKFDEIFEYKPDKCAYCYHCFDESEMQILNEYCLAVEAK